jgi:F-type H+-transporting ATPase subunit alpha
MYAFFDNRQAELVAELRDKKAIDDDLKKRMVAALDQFKKEFTA